MTPNVSSMLILSLRAYLAVRLITRLVVPQTRASL